MPISLLWVQSWHFAGARIGKMNVITVKLRRPTIPKVPRAAKIILGSPKHCRRYGVSYCCSVTQACGRNRRGECSYSSELCLLSAHVRLWVMKKAPPPPPDVLTSAIPATFPHTVRAWALLAWRWCPWALALLEKWGAALIQFHSIQH